MPLQILRNEWLFSVHLSGCVPWRQSRQQTWVRVPEYFWSRSHKLACIEQIFPGLLRIHISWVESEKALDKIIKRKVENRVRARTQTCFTLSQTSNGSDCSSPKLTDAFIPVCKADTSHTKFSGFISFRKMFHNASLFTVSKVFVKSINIMASGAYSVQCISPVFIARSCPWFLGLHETHTVLQEEIPPLELRICWAVCSRTLSLEWRKAKSYDSCGKLVCLPSWRRWLVGRRSSLQGLPGFLNGILW